jgi:hypothetical protein
MGHCLRPIIETIYSLQLGSAKMSFMDFRALMSRVLVRGYQHFRGALKVEAGHLSETLVTTYSVTSHMTTDLGRWLLVMRHVGTWRHSSYCHKFNKDMTAGRNRRMLDLAAYHLRLK